MTRAPYVMPKADKLYDRAPQMFDTTLGWRMTNPAMPVEYTIAMGETAENVAAEHGITRDDQDAFALESQQRTKRRSSGERSLRNSSRCRNSPPTSTRGRARRLRTWRNYKPAFRAGGTVTAGNSSGVNDGAAALLLCAASVAERHGWEPLGRIVTSAVAGVDPAFMGLGPIPATRKALARASLTVDHLDLVELNEAFAAQSIACMRELALDPATTNVNGGAIALGHPLGCSGARLAGTMLHELRRRRGRYALATMCIGVGQGIATIFERV